MRAIRFAWPVLACGLILSASVRAENDVPSDREVHEHAHEHSEDDGHDDHEDIETLVVTASPLAHNPDDLAVPVDQLDRETILRDLGATLGETVGNRPGVTTSGFTAGASRPVIRGQDSYRTQVLDSGLSTQDASQLSPDHAMPVNPITARSIEIVRGPAVLRYGGGASAGVVNAITNRVPHTAIDPPIRGEMVGSYQHNGDGGDFGAELEGGVGDFAWHLDGLYRNTDDYQNGKGETQDGTDAETWSVSAGGAHLFDQGRLGFVYTRHESEYGIPGEEPVEIDMRTDRYRVEADWTPPVSGLREVNLRGVYSNYTHDEVANGIVGQTFDNDEFDGRLESTHESWFGFIGALGLHGRYQDLKGRGEAEEFLAPSETTLIAGYLFEEHALTEDLDLNLGLRVEGNWVEGTPVSKKRRRRSFTPISGSAAVVAHPGDFTFGFTGSASQRAPSQVELFARGPHEATGTFEIGDPDFDEETSYTGELRVAGDFAGVQVKWSGFATYYDNYLFGMLTGITVNEEGTPDPTGDLDELLYRERSAVFYGGELSVHAELFDVCGGTLGTEWQLDYVRARFTDGSRDSDLPRIPPMRWGGSVFYTHERLSARFGFLRSEAQWNPAQNEFKAKAFTMLNLSASYRIPLVGDLLPVELSFTARNLLDDVARNAASFTKEEVLLPGRSYRLSLNASF